MANTLKYSDAVCQKAYQLALLGATDKQMALVLGVSVDTIDYWKRTRQEFADAINAGKTSADANVAEALYLKACGFEREVEEVHVYKGEVTIVKYKKYFPPDSWAAGKWLGLRARAQWAEVQRVENTQTNININKFELGDVTTEELVMMKKLGLRQQLKAGNDN